MQAKIVYYQGKFLDIVWQDNLPKTGDFKLHKIGPAVTKYVLWIPGVWTFYADNLDRTGVSSVCLRP